MEQAVSTPEGVMSDKTAELFANQKPSPANPDEERSFTLSITLHPNGQLDLTGPLGNKVLAYGLLGAAASKLDELYTIQALDARATALKAQQNGIHGFVKRMEGG